MTAAAARRRHAANDTNMPRIAYVNGRYCPFAAATVHVEDRGYQFGDGVYEVFAVHRGRLVDELDHWARLDRSLDEIRLPWPMGLRGLRLVVREVVRRNRVTDRGVVYLQITRGVAPRAHGFPVDAKVALVITARALKPFDADQQRDGVSVISIPDVRWRRPDIKAIALLPNVLGKQQAAEAGAYEAWQVASDGTVTEGTASNAWIVAAPGALITRPANHCILNGIARCAVSRLATADGMTVTERPFSVDEAKSAPEAFLTGTTSLVKPVVRIDDCVIGDGRIGPTTSRLLDLYVQHMDNQPDGLGNLRA